MRIQRWMRELGLDDAENRAWAMYDWANSAFATTMIAAVFPIFYKNMAAVDLGESTATSAWGYTNSAALFLVAIISPVLGAAADWRGAKKRFLAAFALLGVIATAALFFVAPGGWFYASALYTIAFLGFAGANVFYDSLLSHVGADDRRDALSASGYALGYLGGGVLLAVNLAMILRPHWFGLADATQATRWAFVTVAVWWAVFSLPLLLRVREPARRVHAGQVLDERLIRASFRRLTETFRELRQYPDLLWFLAAFWLYSDGIGTIIKMANVYGDDLGFSQGDLIGALLMTQFVGVPFAFGYGLLARRIGAMRGLYLGLSVYAGISVAAFFMTSAWQFWVLAFMIATVQGGTQALSRSVYSSLVPKARSSEFFGFYSISSKFAGIAGPFLFAVITQITDQSRWAILSLVVFFIGGLVLLRRVDLPAGREVAAAEDATFVVVDSA